jgi:hypothetical protein
MDKQNAGNLSASSGSIPKNKHNKEETLVNEQIVRIKKLREEYERLITEG